MFYQFLKQLKKIPLKYRNLEQRSFYHQKFNKDLTKNLCCKYKVFQKHITCTYKPWRSSRGYTVVSLKRPGIIICKTFFLKSKFPLFLGLSSIWEERKTGDVPNIAKNKQYFIVRRKKSNIYKNKNEAFRHYSCCCL